MGKGTVGVTGIWGSGPHDIWALGGTEGVLHHD
jgi:hypothetical protein